MCQSDGKTAREKGNAPEEAFKDSACLCYAHRIAGNLRAVRPSRRDGTAFEKALQLDDARKAGTHEEVLRHDPQSLERDPALLRAPYTNTILEGMNSIIQNIKRRARGFRNDEYFKTMIYLGCGKLNLNIQIP